MTRQELDRLEALFLSIESVRLDATPDEDYLDEDDEDGFDLEELNDDWCASRGVR